MEGGYKALADNSASGGVMDTDIERVAIEH